MTCAKPVDKSSLQRRYLSFIERFPGLHCIGAQGRLSWLGDNLISASSAAECGRNYATDHLVRRA
jgi:hypothetical protein